MTPPLTTPPSLLRGLLWCLPGVIALVVGIAAYQIAVRDFSRWLHDERYVEAELEITSFHPNSSRRQGRRIEGVIHPGGDVVTAYDTDVAVSQFVVSADRAIRFTPTPTEIEGKRIAVRYWPNHAAELRWWHPPTVIAADAIESTTILRDTLLGTILVSVGVLGFRRGLRILSVAIPRKWSRRASRGRV